MVAALAVSFEEMAVAWALRRVWWVRIRVLVALEERVGCGGLDRGGRPEAMGFEDVGLDLAMLIGWSFCMRFLQLHLLVSSHLWFFISYATVSVWHLAD